MDDYPIVAVALLQGEPDEVLICRRIDGEGSRKWNYPHTTVAEGEDFYQAFSRVATMTTGVYIDKDRFGNFVRDVTVNGTRYVSARANLSSEEKRRVYSRTASPCGSRAILVVSKPELPNYIPYQLIRRMIEPGH